MTTEDAPPIIDVIEVIEDDNDPFGERPQSHTVQDTGGPRWIGAAAVAALLGIIGYGVATSASSGLPQVAPPATTTAPRPTTTIAGPTTTDPAPLVPYYTASTPPEYTISYARTNEPDGNYYGHSGYELWSTDQATADSGAWFSIETVRDGSPLYAVDSYSVKADDRSVAISHLYSGQSVAHFAAANGVADVTITAFGIADERLIDLARSVTVVGNAVQLNDDSWLASFRPITAIHPWLALEGIPAEQVAYQSNGEVDDTIELDVSPRPPSNEGGGTLDRQTAIRFFLEHPTSFSVDGHVAAAGSVVGQPDLAVATWIAGDHIVTITGSMPVPDLITVAGTVHQVPDDEWKDMQFQAEQQSGDKDHEILDQSPAADVATGTDAAGGQWTVRVAMSTLATEQHIGWQWQSDAGYESRADDTAKIESVVDNDRTYVLADLPRSVAATATLEVARQGLDPVVVPFVDVDPSFDRTFAAYAFSDPTSYTAQIVGDDGAVLGQWPAAS